MKKHVVFIMLLALTCASINIICASANDSVYDNIVSQYTVDVMQIKINGHAVVKARLSGTYYPEDNTIEIRGSRYSVKENEYTDENRSRETYKYVANNIYFFNL